MKERGGGERILKKLENTFGEMQGDMVFLVILFLKREESTTM